MRDRMRSAIVVILFRSHRIDGGDAVRGASRSTAASDARAQGGVKRCRLDAEMTLQV